MRGSVGSIEGLCPNLGSKRFLPAIPPCFTDGETEAQEVKALLQGLSASGRSAQFSRFYSSGFVLLPLGSGDTTP